jgi:glycosyltransferase involved in cell wall biosynthesis
MIHERFPQTLDPQGKAARAKQQAVEHARAVICISERTKQDLLETYRVSEDRVHVVHLASDMSAVAGELGERRNSARPYFMYVGARTPYKNFDGLLAAMRFVIQRFPDAQVQLVGPPWRRRERARYGDWLRRGTLVNHGLVSDKQLAELYRDSVALVYPSRYEGFGIPPLEAMWCGTPVVASNSGSIPEVVGDAAQLFDAESTDELATILIDLLQHPERRTDWIIRGQRRARLFSWDKAAAETMAVYQQAAA